MEEPTRQRALRRLAREVAQLRAELAQVTAQTRVYVDAEAARALTPAEGTAVRALTRTADALRLRLAVLAQEFAQLRRR